MDRAVALPVCAWLTATLKDRMTDDCCLLLEQVRHSALIMSLKREGCHSFDFTLQPHTCATFDSFKLCLHRGNVRVEYNKVFYRRVQRDTCIKAHVHDLRLNSNCFSKFLMWILKPQQGHYWQELIFHRLFRLRLCIHALKHPRANRCSNGSWRDSLFSLWETDLLLCLTSPQPTLSHLLQGVCFLNALSADQCCDLWTDSSPTAGSLSNTAKADRPPFVPFHGTSD